VSVPFRRVDGGIILEVRVDPRASRAGIGDIVDGVLKVKLTAAPVDGEANRQLIEILSREFGVRKGAIRILKGDKARRKSILLEGIDGLPNS